MAKRRTEKSCYESAYEGGWLTAVQKLAELACERIAGYRTLGTEFWKLNPWDKIYRREATHAARLLTTPFAFDVIVRAWVSPQGRYVRTLGAPYFLQLVQLEQNKADFERKNLELALLPEDIDIYQKPRPIQRHGKSIREKLEDGQNKENPPKTNY